MPGNTYKIVVVGSSGVGKTALVQRLVEGSFSDESQPTIGVEFKCYPVLVGDEQVKLNIWDTAGQEKFRSVSKAYFRNAVGAVLVFAINNRDSFDELDNWLNDLHTLSAPNASIIVVGNKCDMDNKRVILNSEAISFADRHAIEYLETSALNDTNVTELFVRLANEIHEKVKNGEIQGNFVKTSQSVLTQKEETEKEQNNIVCGC